MTLRRSAARAAAAGLALGWVGGIRAGEPAPVSLAALLEEAAAASPVLAAGRAERDAAAAREPQAAALPDPMLRGMAMPELAETRLELEQTFPLAGKRRLGAAMARREARVADHRLAGEALAVAYRVRAAYFDYWLLVRSIAITRENLELVGAWEAVARMRYAGGRATQQNLIKVDVELGALENRLRSLEQQVRTPVARLNALLGRPAGSPLGPPDDADAAEVGLAHPLPELRRMASEASPELAALDAEAERAELAGTFAARAKVPDLTLGLRYTRERMGPDPMTGRTEDRDSYMPTIGVSLPVSRAKYEAIARQAREEGRAARLRAVAGQQDLMARLEAAHFEYQDAVRRLRLYRDRLLPRARQSLEAAFAGFQTGSGGFLDLVDAQRELLEFQLEEARAMAEHQVACAELGMLVGRPVGYSEPSLAARRASSTNSAR